MTETPEAKSKSDERYERYFGASHVKKDLRGRSVRGGVTTLGTQALVVAIGLLGTAVLARLLTPRDFGLVAMVGAVRELMRVFTEMGLPAAIVQRAQINHAQISTLFWINQSLGVGFGILLAVLAAPVAWFYGDARLEAITIVIAFGIPLGVAGAQHLALLRRQMRFGALAATRVAAAATSTAVAIVLAFAGFNYWALVAMQLSRSSVMSAGAWWLCDWRPGRPARGSGIGQMLRFGGNLTGVRLTNFVRRNLDKILIGKFVDASTLGLYTKAANVLQMPMRNFNVPLSAVAVPALSRLADEPQRYRSFYRKSVQFPMLVGLPIVAFAFLATQELVLIVLGSQWTGAVPLFRALLPAALIATTSVTTTWVFVSLGHTGRHLRNALLVNTLTVIGISVGLAWGALGVALAISVVQCAVRIPS
ncbi:MAG: lipopolysaccharide biosynthesis protein, partial [Gammaproteobacteria bacterium]